MGRRLAVTAECKLSQTPFEKETKIRILTSASYIVKLHSVKKKSVCKMMLPAVAAAAAASACAPTLLLDASSQDTLTFRPSCGSLAASSHAVFAGTSDGDSLGVFIKAAASSEQAITVPRSSNHQSITIAATDSSGNPLLQDFTLHDLALHDSHSQASLQRSPWPLVARSIASPASSTCAACSSIMCKPECQHPTNQCSFYAACAEATWSCGPNGYPIGYGLKNCNKFMDRLSHFSSNGQAWIMKVLTCLQDFLVAPLSSCNATCSSIYNMAFDSHPQCYLKAGVCSLSLADMVQLVITVNTDLFAGPALKQALTVAGGCVGQYIDLIKQEISKLETQIDGNGAEILGKITLLEGAQKILESWS